MTCLAVCTERVLPRLNRNPIAVSFQKCYLCGAASCVPTAVPYRKLSPTLLIFIRPPFVFQHVRKCSGSAEMADVAPNPAAPHPRKKTSVWLFLSKDCGILS